MLIALLGFTGATAVMGGALLALRPDGSFLRADVAALEQSPFDDWRAPGLLLASLVGGGGLVAAAWVVRRGRYAKVVAILYAVGLVAFEAAEWAWIGPQPLEIVFGAVGVGIAGTAAGLNGSSARAS